MIRANQQDFQKSYRKHYHTYINCCDNSKISDISRSLILVYCVESGLKYVLMKEELITSVEKARDDLQVLLNSHDFERLLINIPKCPKSHFRFKPFKTKHGDDIRAGNYHQMLRYAISADNHFMLLEYNNQLREIADWIGDKVKEYGA